MIIFLRISAYSILIPIICSLFMKQSDRRYYALIIAFIYMSGLLYLISLILSVNHIHNHFLSHISTLYEVLLLGFFYYKIFKNTIIKKTTLYLMFVLILFIFINAFFIQGINHFNSYSRMPASIYFIFLTFTYLSLLFKNTPVKYLEREPVFWINTGILFYFTGTIFAFVLYSNANFVFPDKFNSQIWFVNSFFNILLNVLFSIGFICNRKT